MRDRGVGSVSVCIAEKPGWCGGSRTRGSLCVDPPCSSSEDPYSADDPLETIGGGTEDCACESEASSRST